MESSQNTISQCSNSALEALKRAYEECPNSTAGSFIIIAFNAIIRLENELEKDSSLHGHHHAGVRRHFQSDYRAAA